MKLLRYMVYMSLLYMVLFLLYLNILTLLTQNNELAVSECIIPTGCGVSCYTDVDRSPDLLTPFSSSAADKIVSFFSGIAKLSGRKAFW